VAAQCTLERNFKESNRPRIETILYNVLKFHVYWLENGIRKKRKEQSIRSYKRTMVCLGLIFMRVFCVFYQFEPVYRGLFDVSLVSVASIRATPA